MIMIGYLSSRFTAKSYSKTILTTAVPQVTFIRSMGSLLYAFLSDIQKHSRIYDYLNFDKHFSFA